MRCLIYFGTIEEVFPEMYGHGMPWEDGHSLL